MKNISFILLLSFFALPLFVIGQSKLVMGGGMIFSSIEHGTSNSFLESTKSQDIKPFVGFSYEYNLNKNFFLSANANYSKQEIFSHGLAQFDTLIRIDVFAYDINFVQISAGVLFNYKIFAAEKHPTFLNGFNIGLGINLDHLRDFEEDSFGNSLGLSPNENRNQLGLLYHLSWDYKKFRLTYNIGQGLKMFGNQEIVANSIDWRTLSASYIYTLSD